tara:strand:- start:5829 stop:6161 length:333 start_codon:yes stop_codon:yes gene_type:complete
MFFPDMFDLTIKMDMFEERKQRIIAFCEAVKTKKTKDKKKLLQIEKRLLQMVSPKNFMGENSEEISFEKNFQFLCHGLNEHTNKDVKKMTVVEVYSLIEMLKKREQNGKK